MCDSDSDTDSDDGHSECCCRRVCCCRRRRCLYVCGVLALIIAAIWLAVELSNCKKQLPETIRINYPPSYNTYHHAAVATDAGPCSTIAKDILQKGGSAVDAAIGAALCVSVLNPHSNSIGGGSFICIYDDPSGHAISINAREVAPSKATKYMYYGKKTSKAIGSLSVAIPGEIAGYWEAHTRYKKLAWKEVFHPILDLISTHPEVTKALGKALVSNRMQATLLNSSFNLDPIFVDANGNIKVENDTVARSELGATLRYIAGAGNGKEAFYEGAVATRIVEDLKDAPGESIITEDDLKNYKAEVKPMIRLELGELTVLTPGAPSGGPVLVYILNILKGYNFTPEDLKDTDAKILTYHRILEAFKFAYAKRAELGDPNFDDTGDVEKAVEDMTNAQYAIDARMRIRDLYTQHMEYYGSSYYIPPEDSGSTHTSIFAKDGSAVSITSSINRYLGSGVRGLRTGIIFNNNMDNFNNPDDDPSNRSKNFIEGGKRPLSSMAPTIIKTRGDGGVTVKMVLGASGGVKIPTATAWTIVHMVWFEMNLEEAINTPRLHHQLNPDSPYQAMYEEGKFSEMENERKQKKKKRNLKITIVVLAIVLTAAVVIIIWLGIEYSRYLELLSEIKQSDSSQQSPTSSNTYNSAAVATDAGPCSTIGKDLLNKGGSAVDAAIGAALCVSVLNTQSNSIAGGSFIFIYNASTGDAVYINARDVAPASAQKDMYNGKGTKANDIGALSVAVPGEIAGFWEAHKRCGRLSWKDVFQPTIDLVLNYPKITKALGKALQDPTRVNGSLYNSSYNLEPIFLDENGNTKTENNTVSRAELGATLRHIANNGGSIFYEGLVAKQIVQDLMDAPGKSIITEEDLRNYKVEAEKKMIRVELGDLTVLTPGAPSGGPVLAYILNILKGYNFTPEDVKTNTSRVLTYHRILEAFKFAYAKRSELGDPNFDNSGDVQKAVDEMTNEQYAEETRHRINDSYTQKASYYGLSESTPPKDSGTTHISILAEDGSAVSITSSMNKYLGSNIRGLRTGIIFNDNMSDFNIPDPLLEEESKNFIEGGKRPLSSMAPTIIIKRNETKDKAVQIVVGAAGGIKIPTATAWTIMQMLWFGKTLEDAIEAPRLHHQLDKDDPYRALYEEGKFSEEIGGLMKKGHNMTEYERSSSVVQGIRRLDSEIEAKSDDRKGGYPDGY